jgi:hypothetical protein
MKWPWGSIFNYEQRKETAKMLLGICQIIILAIIAGPFIPDLAKRLTLIEIIYGFILITLLYLIAMRLLKEVKNQ